MIRFALRCLPQGHSFEAWFRSGDDFDMQSARGLVGCPACGSSSVEKALMAPSVSRSGADEDAHEAAVQETPAPAAPALPGLHPPPEMQAALRAFREKVLANSQDVGHAFAEEARKMHFGEAEQRGIHGQASPEEVRSLAEDGIGIMPVPVLPEDAN